MLLLLIRPSLVSPRHTLATISLPVVLAHCYETFTGYDAHSCCCYLKDFTATSSATTNRILLAV